MGDQRDHTRTAAWSPTSRPGALTAAGVWSRDGNTAYRAGRDIKAGRVWTDCYHAYPAHAAFGGYKQSGIGRENHTTMLDHYQQTKKPAGVVQRQGPWVLLIRDQSLSTPALFTTGMKP